MKSKKELLKTMSETLELLKTFDNTEEKESNVGKPWYLNQPVSADGFIRYLSGKNEVYSNGSTSESSCETWFPNSIKPNYNIGNVLNFIPNTGIAPVLPDGCIGVIVKFDDEYQISSSNDPWDWNLSSKDLITHYCILKKPVLLKDLQEYTI